ncbi:hypothetical protein BDR26DRAFT_583662 [Obelidium mucronatum]|nr:hypothetical protein BDR26DRAFT_583662 [Obelidium mucronatum]
MKRPTKLIPMVVINSKQQQQVSEDGTPVIVTPGLAILRKIDRLLQTYVEASESGVFTVSQTGVKEWSETVSRQVNRSIEREEVKSDEVLKMERQRIERERVEAAERERKEQARIDAELKRQAAAEEKERVLIAKREAKEEQERREALMKEEAAKAKAVEAEREKLRQKGLEESRVMRDELMRKQTPGYESHNNQHTQPAAKASAIRVVRVPRNKPSTSSLQSNNNVDVEADAPVSVKRLDYGVNRVPKFGSHGEESRVEVKSQPMCKFFNTSNGCRNGTNCKNLHVNSGAVAAESDNSVGGGDVEVCKYFNTKAGCRFGDKCRHAHIEGQQRPFRAHKQSKIKEGEDAVVV